LTSVPLGPTTEREFSSAWMREKLALPDCWVVVISVWP
jgi:hypothetical protein